MYHQENRLELHVSELRLEDTMSLIDQVLERLQNVKQSGSGFIALCPAHPDKQRSLSVSEKDGTILLKCFTGCKTEDIVVAIGLEMKDLFLPSENIKPKVINETTWDIETHTGKVVAQHCRTDYNDGSKRFYWKRNGKAGLGGYKIAKLPLYGLKYLNGCTKYCILTEGEKAADSLNNIGELSFGTVCGASSIPSPESLELLANFNTVFLWPDNDAIGIQHMTRIANHLKTLSINPFLIQWAGAPDKGDAFDFIAQGNTDIAGLMNTAVIWPPPITPAAKVDDDPYRYGFTDTGNAERFVRDHAGNVHYCPERGRWLLWTGIKWDWDNKTNTRVLQLSKDTVRNMYHEAGDLDDIDKRRALVKFANQSEAEKRRRSMLNLAVSENNIVIAASDTDSNNLALNCKNGTVNLTTGKCTPHDKNDLNTKIINIDYDAYDAECPTWHKFLDDVTNGDDDLQEYLQKAVGYSLSGDIREQCLFFLYGRGQNGKSTFINTILYVLGPYGHQADMDIFMLKDRNASGPKEGLADLQGRRFVAATELEEGRKLATATVKMVTGGEMITADRKHEHYISFWPTHKIWLSGNHKPRISDTTDSIWRRLKLIPFTTKVPNPDEKLFEKLKAEKEGILAWAILGCLLWQSTGLNAPRVITSATKNYRDDQDEIGEFIQEYCVIYSTCKIYTSEIYNQYLEWSKQNNVIPLGVRRFNGKIEEKGFIKNRGTGNKLEWLGLGLKTLHQEGFNV